MTTTATALTREVDGATVPVVGVWEFDQGHTLVGFEGRHLMVTRVRGRFNRFSGRLSVAERPEESIAEIDIEAASLESGFADRDEHLRSADFFDVVRFPTITFRSTRLSHVSGSRWVAEGQLTVRDVIRPVLLECEFEGVETDPWGNHKLGFTARGRINREDFGLTWNMALETGGLLAGKEVALQIEVEAVLAEELGGAE